MMIANFRVEYVHKLSTSERISRILPTRYNTTKQLQKSIINEERKQSKQDHHPSRWIIRKLTIVAGEEDIR